MPAELSDYERQRLKNIAENRKVLEELGIFKPFKPDRSSVFQKPVKRKRPKETTPRKARKIEDEDGKLEDQGSSYAMGRRKSRRLQGQVAPSKDEMDAELSKVDDDADYKPKPIKRENTFGAIPGVEVGTHWDMRLECSRDGIHRPTVAGIHGNELEGCYSVALSGGYEDDLDLGECFTFTGEGGRDLKGTKANPKNLRTAPQSKDQTLTRGNMALSKNVENRRPVRVIRGFKLDSPFAPDEGYRYDGLYTVEKFWFTTGLSGHGVYKFALRRCKDQAPPPWEIKDNCEDGVKDGSESGYGSQQDQKEEEENKDSNSDTSSDISSSISPVKIPENSSNNDEQQATESTSADIKENADDIGEDGGTSKPDKE